MKTILVTGGAGFIGSNFCHYLLKQSRTDKVIALDTLTYAGNLENLKSLEGHPQLTFVKASICDQSAIEKVFQEQPIDIIVHFAAESHVDRSIENSQIFIETNVLGTQVLLECAKKHHCEKFIHVSTDEVYGSLGETGEFTEDSPLQPNSPYAASKAASDLLVRSYFQTYKLPVIITRCSNNYGPYQFPEKLIPLMINNILSQKKLPVYGTGTNIRDWLYVEDHCDAILTLMNSGSVGEVYNIGGGTEMTNLDLVKYLIQSLNADESLIDFVPDRLGHDFRYAINFDKLNTELNWKPKTSFEEGLKKTISWYVSNEEWLQDVTSGDYQNYYERHYINR